MARKAKWSSRGKVTSIVARMSTATCGIAVPERTRA
jgi:hypothetical protein